MMTPEQSEQAAESLLDQPKAEAVVAAVTTIAALGYLENTFICLLVGAVVGGLFGLAARRD